jgi:hypothetical protein
MGRIFDETAAADDDGNEFIPPVINIPPEIAEPSTDEKLGNWMLIELEWRPADEIDLPETLSAYFFNLGEPVEECDDASIREDVHLDPAAEDCQYKVAFDTGEQIFYDPVTGWVIKGDDKA